MLGVGGCHFTVVAGALCGSGCLRCAASLCCLDYILLFVDAAFLDIAYYLDVLSSSSSTTWATLDDIFDYLVFAVLWTTSWTTWTCCGFGLLPGGALPRLLVAVSWTTWTSSGEIYFVKDTFGDEIDNKEFSAMAEDERKDDRGFDSYIPVWDGRSDTLRDFRRSVTWWLSSIDLKKTTDFNLAARFAMRQKGSAKLRALEFDPKDLEFRPARTELNIETGVEEDIPVQYDYGIQKILTAWEEMVGRTALDRKGELRERFYLTLKRGPTESIPNFAMRFRTLVGEMKAEGVHVDQSEQAWFFKQKLQLSEMQKQMLETTLGSDTDNYGVCEREAVRLFKRVHTGTAFPRPGGGNFQKRPSSLTSSALSRFRKSLPSSSSSTVSSSWRGSGKGRMGSAYVTEAEDAPVDEETPNHEVNEATGEAADDDGAEEDCDDEFQGLQETLEILATELDEAAAAGHSEEELSALEQQVGDAVEALVTLREARAQIGALRKDRGFKGRGGAGGKAAGRGRGGTKEGKCFVCGKPGHWQGDAECPGPPKGQGSGQGQRPLPKFPKPMKKTIVPAQKSTSYKPAEGNNVEANVVDLIPSEVAFTEAAFGVRFEELPEIHEINVVSTLSEALAASSSTPGQDQHSCCRLSLQS